MVKNIEKKDFGDIKSSWENLLKKVDFDEEDFQFYSIKPRKEIKYFHAKVENQYIVIDRATKHSETAELNGERRIDFKQFKCVAPLYNQYIVGTKGIRPKMRDNCGQNTSYIISLISHLL